MSQVSKPEADVSLGAEETVSPRGNDSKGVIDYETFAADVPPSDDSDDERNVKEAINAENTVDDPSKSDAKKKASRTYVVNSRYLEAARSFGQRKGQVVSKDKAASTSSASAGSVWVPAGSDRKAKSYNPSGRTSSRISNANSKSAMSFQSNQSLTSHPGAKEDLSKEAESAPSEGVLKVKGNVSPQSPSSDLEGATASPFVDYNQVQVDLDASQNVGVDGKIAAVYDKASSIEGSSNASLQAEAAPVDIDGASLKTTGAGVADVGSASSVVSADAAAGKAVDAATSASAGASAGAAAGAAAVSSASATADKAAVVTANAAEAGVNYVANGAQSGADFAAKGVNVAANGVETGVKTAPQAGVSAGTGAVNAASPKGPVNTVPVNVTTGVKVNNTAAPTSGSAGSNYSAGGKASKSAGNGAAGTPGADHSSTYDDTVCCSKVCKACKTKCEKTIGCTASCTIM